ncbi:MAG: VacJ family lipoprotein [Burkholderiales bacterium]
MLDEKEEGHLVFLFPARITLQSRGEASRQNLRRTARGVALLVLVCRVVGCAQPTLRRDWSGYDGPGAAAFHRETLPPPNFPDPIEPVNRGLWGFNHALIVGIADPVGKVYRVLIPPFIRDRISDFAANLIFPRNLVANLIQGRWDGAGRETSRFAINTTLGVAGLWDPATQWFGIQPALQDFGQVFARWGWQPATFLVLPVAGPSSTRDTVGLAPDAALDPATYFFPAGPVLTYNDLVDSIDAYVLRASSSADFYDDARLVSTLARDARIEEPETSSAPGVSTGATQTLQAAFLGPRDPGFAERLDRGEVTMPGTGRALPYSYRMQPGRAPLVFLVPGLGAHRLSNSSLALAEMAYARGFSVAVVSSTLNFEFIERGGSVPVPGHAPVDAHDVHVALDAIDRDLGARYPESIGARIYLGYSLGAFHGFFIAAEEQNPANKLVRFDRYLLLDPPVRLFYGMERLDAFNNVPLAFPAAERDAEVRRILLEAVVVGQKVSTVPARGAYTRIDAVDLRHSTLTPDVELPFSNEEAEYLIGLAFRRALQAVLWTSQQREDLGVLLTERRPLQRLPAYKEIGDYSFTMYLYAFVLPYYRDRLGTIASAEELVKMNDLHAIADPLRGNPKLRVFANRNDFLTSDADIEWLTVLVGPERTRFFPTGGHLGNLHRPEVQAEAMASLEDLRPAQGTSDATLLKEPPQ